MKKTIVKNPRIGEQYYEIEHDSGLKVLCYPMERFQSAYALFGTRYGSIDRSFRVDPEKDFKTIPDGIAHYLEHKLFESEEGDAFGLFAKYGASANAFTSFDRTAYLFSCTEHFGDCLRALLNFVQSPYFTEENVEKERGIIGQEIRMYDDDPSWQVFFQLLGALYHNHPVKIDIAGTVESIAKITPELLYDCYRSFYSPDQMVLAIAGRFSVEEVLSIVDELCLPKPAHFLERKQPDEPLTIVKQDVSQSLDVALPLFEIGWKEVPYDGAEGLKAETEITLLLSCMFGEGSGLYNDLRNDGLITAGLDQDVMRGRGYFVSMVGGESKDPKEVARRISNEVARRKKTGVDAKTFERVQRLLYGRTVLSFSRVSDVANSMLTAAMSDTGLFDRLEMIASTTVDDLNRRLSTSLLPERMALSTIYPKANS